MAGDGEREREREQGERRVEGVSARRRRERERDWKSDGWEGKKERGVGWRAASFSFPCPLTDLVRGHDREKYVSGANGRSEAGQQTTTGREGNN